MGRAHAMAYRDLIHHYGLRHDAVKVIGVATSKAESAREAADEIGCDAATADFTELLARPDVHVVDICTPHASHETVAIAAARAGKHIYLEKPLARSLEEGRRIASAVAEAGVKCALTFNFRFFPCVQRAKRLIAEGFLGRVFHFSARYARSSYVDPGRPMSWRLRKASAGGGVLIDSGAHVLDFAQWLLGDVAAVRAELRTPHAVRPATAGAPPTEAVDVEDAAFLQMRLADGAFGTIEVTRMATGATNDIWFDARGQSGALRFTLEEPNWLYTYDARHPERQRGFTRVETVARFDGSVGPDWSQPVGVSRTHAECQYRFLRAIWDGAAPSPSITDGLRVQAIATAAYRSAETEAWVDVEAT